MVSALEIAFMNTVLSTVVITLTRNGLDFNPNFPAFLPLDPVSLLLLFLRDHNNMSTKMIQYAEVSS